MKIILLALCVILSFGCYSQVNTSLPPNEFKNGALRENVQVLDVRTPGEFQSGHIQHALLADWNNRSQFMERIKYVDKTKPVYVYCLSGGRSGAAAKWMRENGYNSVYELQGGINAWKIASLPLEGTPNTKQMTVEEYQSQIGNSGLVLVDFGAEWCPPCKKMEPVIDQLQKDLGRKFKLVKVDAGVHIDVMKQINVSEIPVFIIYKNGKEIWRKTGVAELDEFKKQISAN
ncbi:MAG: thioredoxin fold domain-containing protein [Bacteroidetes bacterium]|nr:thioredoxin fold domain-containing protein [Bacteroidota bacterium]